VRSQNLGRNIRLALVAAFACLFAAGLSFQSSAQQPAGGAGQQQRQPGPDVPAEQVFKNIQVLKGMPSDQLSATMDFFSTSLGVRCDFCHARNASGGLDAASDAKEEKKTARAMIAMQMDLNAHHLEAFDGERISCYTCHQGHASAPHFPRLPLAPQQDRPAGGGGPGGQPAAQPGAQGAATSTPAQAGQPAQGAAPAQGQPPAQGGNQGGQSQQPPRPTAEQVLAKYVAAVGGDAAKIKTLLLRGTREGARGGAAPYEVTLAPPDRLYVVATIPAQGQQPAGELRQGINGAGGGWTTNARGARALSPAELADLRNAMLYMMPIKIAQPLPQMRVLGRARVGDSPAWVLEAKPAPNVRQLFFFDQQSGLLLRQLTIRSLFLQDVPEQVDYEDYRDVDGVKFPFTVRSSSVNPNNPVAIRKFTEIKLNPPADETIFAMPAPKP
jgi:Photosynthetic reaction centre cytochrome C subunit